MERTLKMDNHTKNLNASNGIRTRSIVRTMVYDLVCDCGECFTGSIVESSVTMASFLEKDGSAYGPRSYIWTGIINLVSPRTGDTIQVTVTHKGAPMFLSEANLDHDMRTIAYKMQLERDASEISIDQLLEQLPTLLYFLEEMTPDPHEEFLGADASPSYMY